MNTIENKRLFHFRNEEKIGFYETVKSYVNQVREPEFVELYNNFAKSVSDYNNGKILYDAKNCLSYLVEAHKQRIVAFKTFKNYVLAIKNLGNVQLGLISEDVFAIATNLSILFENTTSIERMTQSKVTGRISIIIEQLSECAEDLIKIKAEELAVKLIETQENYISSKHNYSKEKLEIPTGYLSDLIGKIDENYRNVCEYLEASSVIKNDENINNTITKINHLVKSSKICRENSTNEDENLDSINLENTLEENC